MLAPEVWRVAQGWIRKADSDLRNTALVLPAEDAPLDTVCFHAQQAAEKCIKALLTCHGVPFGRTHDLAALMALLPGESRLHGIVGDTEELTQAAVAPRYPDRGEYASRDLADRLVAQARRIRDAVSQEIDELGPPAEQPAGG